MYFLLVAVLVVAVTAAVMLRAAVVERKQHLPTRKQLLLELSTQLLLVLVAREMLMALHQLLPHL
jgi:hypothetical protein